MVVWRRRKPKFCGRSRRFKVSYTHRSLYLLAQLQIRHYTEDIPDISLYEIRMALKELKNNKVPGEDGITSELLESFRSFSTPSYSKE